MQSCNLESTWLCEHMTGAHATGRSLQHVQRTRSCFQESTVPLEQKRAPT